MDVDHLRPFFCRHLCEAAVADHARVDHQPVDCAIFGERRFDEGGRIADVALHRYGASATSPDGGRDSIDFVAAPCEDKARAGAREVGGILPPEPAARADDHDGRSF